MKKIFSLILIFFCINCFSQFPQYRLLTNDLTRTGVGALQANRGIINGVFTDTTAANADFIDFYNGAQIYTRSDRNFWLRDSVINTWVKMAKFSEINTQNLQSVTDVGSVTTNDITAPAFSYSTSKFVLSAPGGNFGRLSLANVGDFAHNIEPQAASNGGTLRLPNTGNTTDTIATLYDILVAGGGGSQGIDDVINTDPELTTDREILLNNNDFAISDNPAGVYYHFLINPSANSFWFGDITAKVNGTYLSIRDTATITGKWRMTNIEDVTPDTTTYKLLVADDDGKLKRFGNWSGLGGGGSGTINSGTTGRPAYYVGSTTLDDFPALSYATSGNLVTLTHQNTTDVGVLFQGISSQTGNFITTKNSGGTTLTEINSLGKLIFNQASSGYSNPQITLTPGGVRIFDHGGYNLSYSTGNDNWAGTFFAGGAAFNKFSNQAGIYISTDIGNGQWSDRIINIRDTVWEFGYNMASTRPGETEIFKLFDGAGTDQAAGNLIFQPSAGTGNSTLKGDFIWQTPDATGSGTTVQSFTEKMRLTRLGVLKLATVTQDDAVDKIMVWDDSNDEVKYRDVATIGGSASLNKGFTIESPSSIENIGVWQTPVDITISNIKAVLVGSSTPSVTFNIAFGTDRTSGTNVFSSGQTATSTTTGHNFNSGFNDATIPAGSFIWVTTSAQSGTVVNLELTINYTED